MATKVLMGRNEDRKNGKKEKGKNLILEFNTKLVS